VRGKTLTQLVSQKETESLEFVCICELTKISFLSKMKVVSKLLSWLFVNMIVQYLCCRVTDFAGFCEELLCMSAEVLNAAMALNGL